MLYKGSPITKTRLGKRQPFHFLLVSLPSIRDSNRRWATFQIILSFVFFFVAIAIGILTADLSKVEGAVMVIAMLLFMFGMLGLTYALGLGFYWFRDKRPMNDDANKLHEDIQASINSTQEVTRSTQEAIQTLIQEIRQDRNEHRNSNH